MILRQLTPHIMWPLQICYAPKFIQINISLWLVDCTFAICSEKCEVQTLSHQKMFLKDASCPPSPTHLPRGLNCKSWGWTGKAIFLHTGRSHCKWLLLHNLVSMRVENLHYFSNWRNNFRINAILHFCIIFPCRGDDFSFVSIKLAAHQLWMESISDCGIVPSVASLQCKNFDIVSKQKI